MQVPPFRQGPAAHSSMLVQVTPSPSYPALQAQVKEPVVLVQVAFSSQLSVPAAHSSMSVQVTPSPSYPALQAQVKEPTVLVQVAFSSQLSVPAAHSLTSTQVPLWHVRPSQQGTVASHGAFTDRQPWPLHVGS